MADVALDDESDEEDGEQYAHQGRDEGEDIASAGGRRVAKGHHQLPRKEDNSLEQHRRQTAEYTYNHTKEQKIGLLRNMPQPPNMQSFIYVNQSHFYKNQAAKIRFFFQSRYFYKEIDYE